MEVPHTLEHPRRVGVIGHGAVGSVVAEHLATGRGRAELAGVFAHSPVPDEWRVDSFDGLLERSDLVIEAASQDAVSSYGPSVVAAARDLLVVSVGALRDDALLQALRAGPGRLLVTTGAIGGIDHLRAAALLGAIDTVELTTRKPPPALERPWMSPELVRRLREDDEPTAVFEGSAREAVRLFPESINVAATLSLVTIGFDGVRVRMIADPATERVEHVITADGAAGTYEFRFVNVASPLNIRTSAITPYAVLRGVLDLDAPVVIGL